MLAGFDFSSGALSIARSAVPSGHFAEMDAEHMGFVPDSFDRVLCQYALMFFPDPPSVLRQINILLRRGGRLAIAVHGTAQGVPYFSTVMEPVLRHIPGIRPEGTPTVHRFGNPSDLENLIASAGFEDIAVQRHVFDYETGTFDQYWSDYLATTANSIRPKIEAAGEGVVAAIRREAKQRAEQFIQKDGTIKFPWDVLVATALK
jgi:ubiquinone/menaquinone biosynthesis C-methylase UbiE